MCNVIMFGGTTEGRELAELLKAQSIPSLVCVATDYGESLVDAGGSVRVHTGRLDAEQIAALIEQEQARLIIDAAHPYAQLLHQNINEACNKQSIQCVRLEREAALSYENALTFDDMDSLITWLNAVPGIVFSTLGAKEARALTAVKDFAERVYIRMLPSIDGLSECVRLGYEQKHIICMQGPFSKELNKAMFSAVKADILITKDSGAAGGFKDKLEAARESDMTVAVLKRPESAGGISLEEAKRLILGGGS